MPAPTITVGTDPGSADVTLPVADVLTGRAFLTGKSGSGKSNSASVVVEELLDQGHATLIVDADGEYRGLKEQYEVLHVGVGETCDLQVGPEHAGRLAQIALVQNVPVVLDVSEYLDEGEADALVRRTADALYKKQASERRPFLLVVEEVHEYLPEGPALDEVGQTLIRIGKRGRKRGLGLMGISQRPADVKKSFITQCDWLVWHRLTWDNDTKVVRRVVGSEAAETVQHLGDGEAIVVSDWLEESPMRMQWRRKRTIDLGATPGLGETQDVELKGISTEIVEELEHITRQKQQEQKEVERLRSRTRELEDKLAEKEDELERAQDMRDMAKQLADSLTASAGDEGGEAVSQRIEELQAEAQKERRKRQELEEEVTTYKARIEELEEEAQVSGRLRRIGQHREDIEEAVRRLAEVFGIGSEADERLRERLRKQQKQVQKLKESRAPEIDDLASFLEHKDVQRAISRAKEEGSKLQVRRVLESLVDDEGGPTTVGDVLRRAGLSTSSGGNVQNVREAAQALKEVGVVSVRGSDLATKIEIIQDLSRVQERVGRAETRERLKDVV